MKDIQKLEIRQDYDSERIDMLEGSVAELKDNLLEAYKNMNNLLSWVAELKLTTNRK